MKTCDVLVVGGGPGGSSCAYGLAGSGLDVVVLDRKEFPRDKVCAGWVTPQVFEALAVDLDDYARGRVLQPITGFRTGMIGRAAVDTRYARPVSYGIRRCELDDYLLRRSGARLLLGHGVRSIERTPDGWVVDGDLRARMLVGAGGQFCPVARWLGAERSTAPLVRAQEAEYPIPFDDRENVDPAMPQLWFCEDLKGYGWCFRKGDFLNVGLGRVEAEGLADHVGSFVDFLRARGALRGEAGRFRGHAYRLWERVRPVLVDDGVLLVGDAAGLSWPQSGEGIRPAVESGLFAAEVIRDAGGDFAASRLEAYSRRVLGRFGPPRGRGPGDFLPASWLRFLAGHLLASRAFARRVVVEDWFLHADQPAIPLVAPSGEREPYRAVAG